MIHEIFKKTKSTRNVDSSETANESVSVNDAFYFCRSVDFVAERFTFLLELINNRDQQSGRELTRHRDRLVHDLRERERPAAVALCPVDDLVRRIVVDTAERLIREEIDRIKNNPD